MDAHARAKFDARARVLKALAHPTRLFVVDELSRGECCVAELVEMVGIDTSTMSKHLAVLRTVGLVQDEKRGSQVYYRLKVPCVVGFFGCIERVIRSHAEEQMKLAE